MACLRRCLTALALIGLTQLGCADEVVLPDITGQAAPEFTLKNQAGEDVALADLVANSRVALVFVRSADW
ncbi:MAG: hypothetical protein DWQ31_13950 [Planctomycetota bacterium]|nr:MAG: hypothetical protein DWQ31_13950 [Planctomycetota bacterium]REJ94621.1 MAG: hypothetical protein DWQ35_07780 [Planctomycetota bacterium]REK22598.1 MAG: hypothetical protein DWQ42_16790 [Planctomycetota bacterium]REK46610.1 MAG: hypothetical protein DWQ46_06985 [Planctomycetota bacterium]